MTVGIDGTDEFRPPAGMCFIVNK